MTASEVHLILAKMDLILARMDTLTNRGRPGLTQVEFAKLTGKHPRTVNRWVKMKRIRLVKGCIPNDEVQKFLS